MNNKILKVLSVAALATVLSSGVMASNHKYMGFSTGMFNGVDTNTGSLDQVSPNYYGAWGFNAGMTFAKNFNGELSFTHAGAFMLVMGNAMFTYDLSADAAVSVGGGIGLRHDFEQGANSSVNGFAYQGLVRLSHALTHNVTAYGQYSYTTWNGDNNKADDFAEGYANVFRLGVNVNF